MKSYKALNGIIYFRQSFKRGILANLFTVLYTLLGDNAIGDGIRLYPHSVKMTESEFLSCLELAEGA